MSSRAAPAAAVVGIQNCQQTYNLGPEMGHHAEIIAIYEPYHIGHTDIIVSYEMHVPGSMAAMHCSSC